MCAHKPSAKLIYRAKILQAMKKYILIILIAIAGIAPFFMFKDRLKPPLGGKEKLYCSIQLKKCQENLLNYLKLRKDALAALEIEKILAIDPNDLCALWAKAEVFRRAYKFKESEALLKQVLSQYPGHASSLISLSYIRYHENKFEAAIRILKQVLNQPDLERENKALAYMLMGSINAKKSSTGGLFNKLAYGLRVKGFFEKAKAIAPDLTEVHLGLGTFYLLAPSVAGGNVDRAIAELKYAVELTPDFATACARLAQAYKKKGSIEKYNFYLQRARELDPKNEALGEL